MLRNSTVASDALAAKAKECDTLKAEKEKMRKDLEKFQNLSRSQKDDIEGSEAKAKEAEGELHKLMNKLKDLERANANLQKSIDNLQKSSAEKSKEVKIISTFLKKFHDSGLRLKPRLLRIKT